MNEEFLVSTNHQFVLITSLPFVHTARRYYRLNGLVRPRKKRRLFYFFKPVQTEPFRGSKSRNKVSVGEPAEGSLQNTFHRIMNIHSYIIQYTYTTNTHSFDGGSLGSCVDEERGKIRNGV